MSETQTSERDLLLRLRDAREKKKLLDAQLEEANKNFEDAQAAVIEALQARDADATASYEGIGYATLVKPRLYARFDKADEEKVFEFLKKIGRPDLIKLTVNTQSLSGFVGEQLETGQAVPDYIKYFLKPSIRLYE